MKVLVLGITGMLGNKAFSIFNDNPKYETFGALRKDEDITNYFEAVIMFSQKWATLNPKSVFELIDQLK